MYGRQVIGSVGTSYQLTADGNPEAKIGGVTLDWTTVAAVSGSAVTLGDNLVIPIGDKFLAPGQVVTKITATGYYGPYDPAAADGRQLLVRGECFLVNRAVNSRDPKDDYPEVIDGGRVRWPLVKQSGVSAHSLAAGPTRAEFEAAFPRVIPHND